MRDADRPCHREPTPRDTAPPRPSSFVLRPSLVLRPSSFVLLLLTGCAGYQIGHQSLYRPDVRTVYVPVFESESLRRNLGERLTEAVVREIESRTPYKVVPTADADSTLRGRIVGERKHVSIENRNDDARRIDTALTVELQWLNRRGEALWQQSGIPVPAPIVAATDDTGFIPEAGQSLATAHQESLQRLARQIVDQMEVWW